MIAPPSTFSLASLLCCLVIGRSGGGGVRQSVVGVLSSFREELPNLVFGEAAFSQVTSHLAIKSTANLTAELRFFSKQFYFPEWQVLTQSGVNKSMFIAESNFSQRLSEKWWKNTKFFLAQRWLLHQEPVVSVL